jgi:hypothetical protein
MTDLFFIIIGIFVSLLLLDKFTGKGNVLKKKAKTHKATQADKQSKEIMVEYSRENSRKLGFNRTTEGFKRPTELIMKGMTKDQEVQYIKALMKNEQYSKAMKSYIPLKNLYSVEYLRGVTINVFIDTVDDTKVIARDNTAILEIEVGGGYYSMAGEFVLINLDKEGERIKVNFILRDKRKLN